MLIPIGEDDRSVRGTPYVTGSIILVLFACFALLQGYGANPQVTLSLAVIPFELTTGTDLVGPIEATLGGERITHDHQPGPVPLTALTALLLHSGLVHLGGNAFFLWIFGNNVELRIGRLRYAALFLAAGLVGIATHVLAEPASTVPVIGASGAVSGVLGAYAVILPKNRVYVLFFFRLISVPAVVAVALWAGIQAASAVGLWALAGWGTSTSAVSFTAHLGGIVTGALAGYAWRRRGEARAVPNEIAAPAPARHPSA